MKIKLNCERFDEHLVGKEFEVMMQNELLYVIKLEDGQPMLVLAEECTKVQEPPRGYIRTCEKCGKPIVSQGYVVDMGAEYYCSDECLHEVYTPEEWEEMYNGDDDSYWTEWDTIDLYTYEGEVELNTQDVIMALKYLKWADIEEFILSYSYEDVPILIEAIKALKGA